MKKSFGMMVVALLILGCLGGCKEKDTHERINDEIAISEANFPDENFRAYISEFFDPDKSGGLSDHEISRVEEIYVSWEEVSDLTGVEVFSELMYLSCEMNLITKLDVSQNHKLRGLYCGYNRLSSLDVSKNKELKILRCDNNQLNQLKVGELPELWWLICSNNQLSKLDVAGSSRLKWVSCDGNKLTGIDLSKNKKLGDINCSDNQLTKLDVSKNPKLVGLTCSNNQLQNLDLMNNYRLRSLICEGNPLVRLDLSRCDYDIVYSADDGVEVDMTYKEPDNGPAIDDKNFPNENFRQYILKEIDRDKNGILSEREMRTTIDISVESDDLTGIGYFTELEHLNCFGGGLKELDLSHNHKLINLSCDGNQLTELDLSKNTELEKLYCSDNALTKLNLSKNTELFYLECSGNQLEELDLRKNLKLELLNCSDNQLTKLDCSKNTQLTGLNCQNNPLERLDFHNCLPYIEVQLPMERNVQLLAPEGYPSEKLPAFPAGYIM